MRVIASSVAMTLLLFFHPLDPDPISYYNSITKM